ncbi:hypothetical protein H5410_035667 [Solanum commersonii]|uniref:Uncharacterized protein n=1 Tax=Solanum commersonii TaxID=4109 RepID=A0A9J5Y1B8_SOLCO|nr:hypothetical protein H5410_035667 [Solanum commersonii]
MKDFSNEEMLEVENLKFSLGLICQIEVLQQSSCEIGNPKKVDHVFWDLTDNANTINQVKQEILPKTLYKGIRHIRTPTVEGYTRFSNPMTIPFNGLSRTAVLFDSDSTNIN